MAVSLRNARAFNFFTSFSFWWDNLILMQSGIQLGSSEDPAISRENPRETRGKFPAPKKGKIDPKSTRKTLSVTNKLGSSHDNFFLAFLLLCTRSFYWSYLEDWKFMGHCWWFMSMLVFFFLISCVGLEALIGCCAVDFFLDWADCWMGVFLGNLGIQGFCWIGNIVDEDCRVSD
jgi:hypothetical protein